MKISLETLEVLDAIDRYGSFTAAASFLHRVPSAISHAMGRLEQDLEVRIFQKEGRRARLTPAGRTLLEEGRQLLQGAADLEARVRRVATGWEAQLTLAVDGLVPPGRLYPLLQRFYAEGHATTLRLTREVLGGTWDALATQRADLAIGASGDVPSGLATRLLGNVEMMFAIAPQHPLARQTEPITPEEQRRHRAIVVSDTSRLLGARSSGLLPGQPTLTVPDLESKLEAHRQGLGIGYLPRYLVEPALAAGTLVTRCLASSLPLVPIYLAWRVRSGGKALHWFADTLGGDPDWLAGIASPLGPAPESGPG